jgi:dienelactone hydrolase
MEEVRNRHPSYYARKLVKQGYTIITYGAAHQNESGGLPRYLEHPPTRVSDVSAVADYLQTLECVDSSKINLLDICAGGGYATAAATADHCFKAIAIISAYNLNNGMGLGHAGADDPAMQIGTLGHVAGMDTGV